MNILYVKKNPKHNSNNLFDDVLPCVFFFAESSKELEELRAAFSRSLDYMKHDVEERKQTAPTSIFAVFLSWFSFHIIHLPLSL